MIYFGVDPGVSGAIAAVDAHGKVLGAVRFSEPPESWLSWIEMTMDGNDCHAMVEKVSASPQMGVTSAFTFGKAYGMALLALTAVAIPFDHCTPVKWQRRMGCLTKGNKNISKNRAMELWPNLKFTHATADAFLIAEYCRRFLNDIK